MKSTITALLMINLTASSCATNQSEYFRYQTEKDRQHSEKDNSLFLSSTLDPLAQKESQSIDMATSEYKYLGYFVHMRKAIELVWNYPEDARIEKKEGETSIQFNILANGEVTEIICTKSSGHFLLDEEVAKAITRAAPFSPIPEAMNKKSLLITGKFKYVLN